MHLAFTFQYEDKKCLISDSLVAINN